MRKRFSKALRPVLARILKGLRIANYWIVAQFALLVLRTLRRLPPERALAFVDRAARRIGPLMGRHRTALSNLRLAFPEKSEEEIQAIASDMWGNMARFAGEYVFIDYFLRENPATKRPSRIDIVGEGLFLRLREETRPHIIFTGHLGNFELLPAIGAFYDLKVTALFRAPNNPFLAAELLEKRTESMGDLIASRQGSALALARILESGGNIGVLVDQKFTNGVRTTFFGRECESSPLLAKLARQYDCDVYPTRSIRLPGNRFRLELHEKITLPRTANGRVDIAATTQLLNDIVEGWVRENPGQWMWFHRRWEMRGWKRR